MGVLSLGCLIVRSVVSTLWIGFYPPLLTKLHGQKYLDTYNHIPLSTFFPQDRFSNFLICVNTWKLQQSSSLCPHTFVHAVCLWETSFFASSLYLSRFLIFCLSGSGLLLSKHPDAVQSGLPLDPEHTDTRTHAGENEFWRDWREVTVCNILLIICWLKSLLKMFKRSAVRHLTVTSCVLITNDTTEEHNQLETSNNFQQIYFGVKTVKFGLTVCCVCPYKSLAKQIAGSYRINFGYGP